MKLSSINESSSRTTYYTVLDGTQETVVGIPPEKCWPDNKGGIRALGVWLNDFMTYGELIKDGKMSLYQFVAPSPTKLPLDVSLNYVSMDKAQILKGEELSDAIKWLSQFDSSAIINSHYENKKGSITRHLEPIGKWSKGRATHGEMVSVLSDIIKSTGPVVWSPIDLNFDMSWACITTVKVEMTRVNTDAVVDPNDRFDFDSIKGDFKVIGRMEPEKSDEESDEESDEADWWKNK